MNYTYPNCIHCNKELTHQELMREETMCDTCCNILSEQEFITCT
jgi:hypothetical protein